MSTASRLRGLKVKREVPCRLQDKAQVERYLRSAIEEKVPKQKLELEGEMYRLIGAIPKDYDYLNGLVAVYTSQLGGYYEPGEEYYAMAAWMPGVLQMPIAVHELTHALQDQHYALEKFIDQKSESSDQLMAKSALVEGDATAVMIDYSRMIVG